MMLFVASLAIFFMCGCADSDIQGVKNGVLSLDNTRTVEAALNAVMKDVKWRKFVSDSNSTVVEVTGVWKDDIYAKVYKHTLKKMKAIDPNFDESDLSATLSGIMIFKLFPFPGDKVLLQFALSADGKSFQFAYGEMKDKYIELKDISGNVVKKIEANSTSINTLNENPNTFMEWIYVVNRNELNKLK